MDVTEMHDLDWRFATHGWAGCVGLWGWERDCVIGDGWIVAEPKDGQAEPLGSEASNRHFSEIMRQDRALSSDDSSADRIGFGLKNS